ncbi:MAG: hypothetical protein JWM41_3065 [Gemmatimonadetes bacterium]|nr:hypothetical protein [Gemmatimonadota bacterium]
MKTLICCLVLVASRALAQSPSDGPVLIALGLEPTASLFLFNSAGSVRIVGWDLDSMVVRGHASRGDIAFGGGRHGGKMSIDGSTRAGTAAAINIVIYYPRRGTISVKTATGDVTSSDVAGSYYTVAGTIRVSGAASSVEAEAMNGNIDLEVSTPWVRARTGAGHLLIRGSPQDVDASTIDGSLDVASPTILRGRFASVTGDIRYAAAPASGSLFEFSNHGGAVDFLLPKTVSGRFDLSTVSGEIANGFTQVRPVAAGPHSLRLNLGRGDAQITVRTFKGTIRLRPQ